MKSRFQFTVWMVCFSLSTACVDSSDSDRDPTQHNDTETDSNSAEDGAEDSDSAPPLTTAEAYLLSDEAAAEVGQDIVEGNTAFAVKLFKALVAAAPTENVVFSPVSISIALAMTMNGAVDETLAVMLDTLELSESAPAEINRQFLSILQSLAYVDEDVALFTAESIWIAPGYFDEVEEDFIHTLETSYMSGVFEADSAESLNSWIKEETGGHITDMIDKFPEDLLMYLVNAIYFQGAWTAEFDPDDTRTLPFTTAEGTTVDAETMSFPEPNEYDIYTDAGTTVLRLPYGRGKLAMYVIAPSMGRDTIDTYLDNLTGEQLRESLSGVAPFELGGVYLPKFKIEYEQELKGILGELGMLDAFFGGFHKMIDPGFGEVEISRIKHKAFIDVGEAGTEAAASTVVETTLKSEPTVFRPNTPFLFLIRDDRTGTILFMGKVADPSA